MLRWVELAFDLGVDLAVDLVVDLSPLGWPLTLSAEMKNNYENAFNKYSSELAL